MKLRSANCGWIIKYYLQCVCGYIAACAVGESKHMLYRTSRACIANYDGVYSE